jgi:hypothetical protein
MIERSRYRFNLFEGMLAPERFSGRIWRRDI